MDISEVAKQTGLPSSTVRYYEKEGLISAVSAPGERRRFTPQVLDQLALIALGQAGGLSLEEIRAMLPPDGAPQVDRQLLLSKADQLDTTIKRLKAMSEGLRHAAHCPAANHTQCPTFQRLLKAAAVRVKKNKTGNSSEAVSRLAKTLQGKKPTAITD